MNRSYLDGYMNKEALIGDLVGGTAKAAGNTLQYLLDKGWPIALALPLLLGGGAGYIHSKVTSPSKEDLKTSQKKLESAELGEAIAEIERRRQSKKVPRDERTLHL